MDLINLRRQLLLNVHHGGGVLPSAYQQVTYLESTGTQYINTLVDLSDAKEFIIDVDFEILPSASSDNGILCGRTSTRTYGGWKLPNWCDRNVEIRGYGISINGADVLERSVRVKYTFDYSDGLQEIKRNGTTIMTRNNQWRTDKGADSTLIMFAGRNQENDGIRWFARARIFGIRIKFGLTEIRNFIPCYRKADNVAGMYDLANGVFYTNDGTGAFNVGSDV